MDTTRQNRNTSERSGKPSKSWLVKRLTQLSMARQANVSGETLSFFASALSGFSEAAIEMACEELAGAAIGEYQTRWPELGKFEQACREAEWKLRAPNERKPYCVECEDAYGMLYFDKEYRGNRLRGADIALAKPQDRFAHRCSCGGTYRRDRAEKHYSLADVHRLVKQRQEMREKGIPLPAISEFA